MNLNFYDNIVILPAANLAANLRREQMENGVEKLNEKMERELKNIGKLRKIALTMAFVNGITVAILLYDYPRRLLPTFYLLTAISQMKS